MMRYVALVVAGLLGLTAVVRADVKLPPVIGSHMVLQRDMAVPIWGEAQSGEMVTVKFRDQTKTAQADKNGKWLVKLDAMKVGEPATLTITGNNSLTLEDVIVGEVWLGSGQSNMAMAVRDYTKNDPGLEQIANESHPGLRIFLNKKWQVADAKTCPGFSAMTFSFAVPLQKQLDVPMGVMFGAVGGTPSGRWLSPEMLANDVPTQDEIKNFAKTFNYDAEMKKYNEVILPKFEKDYAAWQATTQAAKPTTGPAAQPVAKAPQKPLPPAHPGESVHKIGDLYAQHVQPFVPYAIRGVLWDQGESGTQIQGAGQYALMGALIRGWRNDWAKNGGQNDFAFIYVQKPSGGGCAWDPENPITNKSEKFTPQPAKVPAAWEGYAREIYIKIMQYPNTAMVISSDLGSGTHPTNKSGYGQRGARVALGAVYGQKVEYYGPLYQSSKVEGDKIRVTFSHVGQGLAVRHGEKLQGFMIAGDNKVFEWADAIIEGNEVVVSSPKVTKPVAVRYAWAQNMAWANLFNKDGLPALTFRTDAW